MRIVFKRENGDSPDLTFVEIEDHEGRSIDPGVWTDEGDGFVVCTLPEPPGPAVIRFPVPDPVLLGPKWFVPPDWARAAMVIR